MDNVEGNRTMIRSICELSLALAIPMIAFYVGIGYQVADELEQQGTEHPGIEEYAYSLLCWPRLLVTPDPRIEELAQEVAALKARPVKVSRRGI